MHKAAAEVSKIRNQEEEGFLGFMDDREIRWQPESGLGSNSLFLSLSVNLLLSLSLSIYSSTMFYLSLCLPLCLSLYLSS